MKITVLFRKIRKSCINILKTINSALLKLENYFPGPQ